MHEFHLNDILLVRACKAVLGLLQVVCMPTRALSHESPPPPPPSLSGRELTRRMVLVFVGLLCEASPLEKTKCESEVAGCGAQHYAEAAHPTPPTGLLLLWGCKNHLRQREFAAFLALLVQIFSGLQEVFPEEAAEQLWAPQRHEGAGPVLPSQRPAEAGREGMYSLLQTSEGSVGLSECARVLTVSRHFRWLHIWETLAASEHSEPVGQEQDGGWSDVRYSVASCRCAPSVLWLLSLQTSGGTAVPVCAVPKTPPLSGALCQRVRSRRWEAVQWDVQCDVQGVLMYEPLMALPHNVDMVSLAAIQPAREALSGPLPPWSVACVPCTHPPRMPATPSAQPAYLLASLGTFCRSHALSHLPLPLPLQMCHLTGTAADRVQGHTLDHPVEEHQVTLCSTRTHCAWGLTVMSCGAPSVVVTPTPAGLAPGAAVSGAEHRAGSVDAG